MDGKALFDRPSRAGGGFGFGGRAFAEQGCGSSALDVRGSQVDRPSLLAGGGIIGHPSGVKAGVQSLREAWQAAVEGVPLDEYAKTHPALREAFTAFSSRAVTETA